MGCSSLKWIKGMDTQKVVLGFMDADHDTNQGTGMHPIALRGCLVIPIHGQVIGVTLS